MPLTLYYSKMSPPCKAVLLVANDLGVELVRKPLDTREKKEHLTPEFLKINPQHSIPTLDDNGFVIAESRAITAYLVSKYGKEDSLYPKDAQKRAVVDSRLYFDIGALNKRFADVVYPLLTGAVTELDQEKVKLVKDNMDILNTFLGKTKWVAGDNKTIADHHLAVTASAIMEMNLFDAKSLPNITAWLKECEKSIKGYKEDHIEPMKTMFQMFQEKLKQISNK